MGVTQNIAPVTITFQNTSQGDGLTYNWSFGDGGSSTQANPTHTFQAGVWEVTLTVTNENGSDISSVVIVATQPTQVANQNVVTPPPGFSANDGPPPGLVNQQQNGQQQNGQQQNGQQQQQQTTTTTNQQTMTGPPPGVVTGGAGGYNP